MSINPTLETPSIYHECHQTSSLLKIAKFRNINHDLAIETGRRYNKPIAERLCICGMIETEKHFFLECILFSNLRERFNIRFNITLPNILQDKNFIEYINTLTYERQQLRSRN